MSKGLKFGIIGGVGSIVAAFIIYYVVSLTSGYSELVEYQVTSENDVIEVRNYPPFLTAQIELNGNRDQILEQGIALLEAYFNGANNFAQAIEMHAPYFQQEHSRKGNRWTIYTPLPTDLVEGDIPKPNDDRIQFVKTVPQSYASITFSGSHSDANLKEHLAKIELELKKEKIVPKSKPIYAFYSPGWTLPMARTIDVLTYVPPELNLED